MSESIKLNIYGRNYSVKKDAFSVDPEEVAYLVNAKMRELSGAEESTQLRTWPFLPP